MPSDSDLPFPDCWIGMEAQRLPPQAVLLAGSGQPPTPFRRKLQEGRTLGDALKEAWGYSHIFSTVYRDVPPDRVASSVQGNSISHTVELRYVELGYLELPAISNRIGFPPDPPRARACRRSAPSLPIS